MDGKGWAGDRDVLGEWEDRESKRKELRKVEKLRSTDEKERKEIGMVKREWVI